MDNWLFLWMLMFYRNQGRLTIDLWDGLPYTSECYQHVWLLISHPTSVLMLFHYHNMLPD